jgi:hypothetical protein
MPDDLLQLRIVAEIFWSAAPAQDDGVVVFRLDVGKCDIGRDAVAGLLSSPTEERLWINVRGVVKYMEPGLRKEQTETGQNHIQDYQAEQ